MPSPPAGPTKTPAQPGEINLSLALIAGAFGVVAAAIFGSGSYFDKIDRMPLIFGLLLGFFGIAALLVSVVNGGRGIAYGTTSGPGNPFDRQAKSGIVGVVLICIAATVFGLNKKPDEKAVDEQKIERLDHQVQTLTVEVTALQARLNANTAADQAGPKRGRDH